MRFKSSFQLLLLACWVWLAGSNILFAYHIAGAELTYRCLGSNQYEIRLRLFRDCSQDNSGLPVAGYDDPIYLYVFASNDGSIYTHRIVPAPAFTPPVNPPGLEDCGAVPPQVCLQEGEYRTIITLPPRVGGYDVAWTRCCRNLGITNIVNPSQQGITFLAHIPGTNQTANVCNNLPTFKNYAPLFLCLNKTLVFDHSAIDLDGDSLVYQLTNPFTGINFQGLGVSNSTPAVQAPGQGNTMGPPPYQNVTFNTGYNHLNPFGLSSQCTLNPQTGELQITPNTVGLFVMAVSVLEYRNGVLIAENKRDMQFYVTPCATLQDNPVITRDPSGILGNPNLALSANTDTLYVLANNAFCYAFDITDPDPIVPIVTTQSTSPGNISQTTNPATGDVRIEICWAPACSLSGSTFYIAVKAEDPQDCPYYNTVYDTLWIRVLPPPSYGVAVQTNIAGNTTLGDTILVRLDVDTACFLFTIQSPNTDSVSYQLIAPANLGSPAPSVVELSDNGQIINGRICWPAGCAGVNNTLPFVVRATRQNLCPPNSVASDTVWIRVTAPPNPKPSISHSFSANQTTVADTLYLLPSDQPCIPFTILDSLPGPRLTTRPVVTVTSLETGLNVPPSWFAVNVAPIVNPPVGVFGYEGQVCWTAPCGYFDDLLRVQLVAADSTKCGVDNVVSDTFYIRILPPPNPKPVISHNLTGIPQATGASTILLYADSLVCYPFTVLDSTPASQLSVSVRAEHSFGAPYGGPGPLLTLLPPTSDTTMAGTVCFRPTCQGFQDTIRLIITLLDSIACAESHRLHDTVWIIVSQPPNYPPILSVTIAGQPVADTLEVIAEDTLCVNFVLRDTVADAPFGLHLSALAQMDFVPGTGAAPSLTLTAVSDTLLTGTVCWPSDCGRLGGVVRLRITGNDSATCTLAHSLFYDVFIRVLPKPTQPISLDVQPGLGIIPRGDTLVFQPRRPGCATIRLTDLLNGGDLLLEPIGDIFGQNGYSGITATLSNTVGDTQLEAQFCWQPGCDNLLPGLWPITFRGISSPDCALPVTVDTALFIQVAQPSNSPPTITIEELPSEVLPGQEYCLTVVVQDPDDFALLHLQGTSPEFEAQFGYGAGLRLVASDTVIQPNPHLRLTYCFSPNCYQKRETYTIQVLALDSTSCDTTLAVPASWTTPVADCGIWMPNVFTPNGDGANDDFGPGLLPGVDYYRMTILDRWGNQIFHTANSQRWRGDVRGGGICAEGVYFYVIEYFFHSGTGPRLVDTRTGHVTVLR